MLNSGGCANNISMAPVFVNSATVEHRLDWLALADALEEGHKLPKALIGSTALTRGEDTVLSLVAWIESVGIAVKMPTVFPGNVAAAIETINGGFCLYCGDSGVLEAVIDFHMITKWKTAADSLLAAKKLARDDSENILIVGAGTVAHSMVEAYRAGFPDAQLAVWNRTRDNAVRLAQRYADIHISDDLEAAAATADIICCATMSSCPLIKGDWLRAGQHLDLIGSFRPDMREADDEAMRRSRIFVDNREMALQHPGDLLIPISSGVLSPEDIVADFYEISSGAFERQSENEITLFKNCGGAHLDLMTARYILDACEKSEQKG